MEDSVTLSVHLFFHITFNRDNKQYFYDVNTMSIRSSPINNIPFLKLLYVTTYHTSGNGGDTIGTECNDRNITFLPTLF